LLSIQYNGGKFSQQGLVSTSGQVLRFDDFSG